MPRLFALEDVSLPNAHYAAGDEFTANDAVAHILRLTGKVRDKDAPAPAPKQEAQTLQTRDITAEENSVAPKRGNRYPRRDMRAQED